MHQRSHRATIMHVNLHVLPRTVASARHHALPATSFAGYGRAGASALRYLLRHPLVALTITIACLLLLGSIGEAQEAARLDAQVVQVHTQNDHISQQITQTNALIVQLSQDSAIIAAALKLGYVMPAGASGATNP